MAISNSHFFWQNKTNQIMRFSTNKWEDTLQDGANMKVRFDMPKKMTKFEILKKSKYSYYSIKKLSVFLG